MQLVLLLSIFLVLGACQLTSIDTFTDFVSIGANIGEPVVSVITQSSNFAGGQRNTTATISGTMLMSSSVDCAIEAGVFTMAVSSRTFGMCLLQYRSPGGGPFPPQNVLTQGRSCWNTKIVSADGNNGVVRIIARSATSGDLSSEVRLTVDVRNVSVCLPYVAPLSAYEDIEALDIEIVSTESALDAEIEFVCSQPPLSCIHRIDPVGDADIDNLFAGDSIKLTVQCRNYISSMDTLQIYNTTFPFDNTVGRMNPSSIMCTGATPTTQNVINNELRLTGELTRGELFNCMVVVDLIGAGEVCNITAATRVTGTFAGDPRFPITSHPNVDREGLPDGSFCNPPEDSKLFVQLPPTTLPPTTLPPTTLPPTTLPPTTLPPTTLPPTTLPPTTLPPTTLPPTTLPPTTLPPTTRPPTSLPPTTLPPTTRPPTTLPPTTLPPTTLPPTTLPPTTLPPTTLPPTTLPPTTLPPTTAPPTTEPPPEYCCIFPRIINGTCDCQTFPCQRSDDGSNSFRCDTDEWYCWFFTKVPENRCFSVGYRGQTCECVV